MKASEKRFSSLEEEICELRDENKRLKNDVQYYQEQIDVLKRMVFGAKSEKTKTIAISPNQLHLFEFAHFDEPAVKPTTFDDKEDEQKTKQRKRGRRRVSPELETEEIIISAPEEHKKDESGQPLEFMGYEVSERVHLLPSKLVKQVIKREKYGHKDSYETTYTAPVPPAIIPKGKFSDTFIINVLVEKFFVGVPLYRLIRSFNIKGADLSKSTVSDIVQAGASFFSGIADEILCDVLATKCIHMDETRIKNQKKKELDYFWVCRNRHHCYVHYGGGRSGDEAMAILRQRDVTSGNPRYLMVDDYGGYNQPCEIIKLIRMACWSHVRRKYYDIAKNGNEIAQSILAMIKSIYKVETAVKNACEENNWDEKTFWEKRKEARQKYAKPIIEAISDEVNKHVEKVLPESSLGKALRYTQHVMENLKVYLEDGELPIDNNPAEQAIRLIVIGRNNYIFVGSYNAGVAAAICYTITESCRMNGIDPKAYLAYVTKILHEDKHADLKKLTPFALKDKIRPMPVNF